MKSKKCPNWTTFPPPPLVGEYKNEASEKIIAKQDFQTHEYETKSK